MIGILKQYNTVLNAIRYIDYGVRWVYFLDNVSGIKWEEQEFSGRIIGSL